MGKIKPKLAKKKPLGGRKINKKPKLPTTFKKVKKSSKVTHPKENQENEENAANEVNTHKLSLNKLQQIDPEFYNFLQQNDKDLLKFNVSDDEDDGDEDALHKPSEELEVASDESDFEQETEDRKESGPKVVTLKLLKEWQNNLQTDKTAITIRKVIQGFHSALLTISNTEDELPEYKVEGSAIFNGVIQLCVLELGPAIYRFLGMSRSTKNHPEKCKKFPKIRGTLVRYFSDLLKLLNGVTSSNIITVLLKHLHYMTQFLLSFQTICKLLTRKLINLWGTSEETICVLAFLCILRITANKKSGFLATVLKTMYMTYVRNSKFVSPSTLPVINFMQRSLTEILTLDLAVAYQHVFVYIRQLAVHLRNAVINHKKEYIQMVYSWQFVNSLKLWTMFLARVADRDEMKPLLYPIVHICLGCIKLQPTAQYYPLRFHILEALIRLSSDARIFIPILPFILEVLNGYNFDKKHQKVSMKPLNFRYALRMSKSQLGESGFAIALQDSIYALTLECMASQATSIAFPDFSLLAVTQLKQFLRTPTSPAYNKKLRQLLAKIKENSDFIESERKSLTNNLNEAKAIELWEQQVRNKGTPLSTFYANWNNLRKIKQKKAMTQNEIIADYNLPKLVKSAKSKEGKGKRKPGELFSSSSDEEEVEVAAESVDKRAKVKKLKKKKKIEKKSFDMIDIDNSKEDIIEDIKDW